MEDLEFVGRMNPKRLTSFAEDFKRDQGSFRNDEENRKERKNISKPELETTYERFPDTEFRDIL
jgi:hypothetical protein